jgi:lipopolysaccharide export system protein LptC
MAAGPGLHSRVVAILKVGMPLVALALLLGLFIGQPDDGLDGEGRLVFAPGDVEALGGGLAIRNPTFTGVTSSQDRFRFTAELVEPDAAPPRRAAITDLAGEVTFADGPTVAISGASGDLDVPTQRLDLAGGVVLATADGYRIEADKVTLDLEAGSMVAGDAVETTGPLGRIDSRSLRVAPAAESGEARRFSFSGGVRLLYDPPDQR